MENFMTIVMWLALGGACSFYAKKQGKNPYLWFFIGLFLGIFGLLLLFLMPYIQKKLAARQKNKLQEAPTTAAPILSLEGYVEPSALSTLWYYIEESKQKGPMSFDAFERDWQQGKVSKDTFIWNEELTEWKLFSDLFPLPSPEELQTKKVSG